MNLPLQNCYTDSIFTTREHVRARVREVQIKKYIVQ
jgi:hypothetical protein